jgi:hypothetical protein
MAANKSTESQGTCALPELTPTCWFRSNDMQWRRWVGRRGRTNARCWNSPHHSIIVGHSERTAPSIGCVSAVGAEFRPYQACGGLYSVLVLLACVISVFCRSLPNGRYARRALCHGYPLVRGPQLIGQHPDRAHHAIRSLIRFSCNVPVNRRPIGT